MLTLSSYPESSLVQLLIVQLFVVFSINRSEYHISNTPIRISGKLSQYSQRYKVQGQYPSTIQRYRKQISSDILSILSLFLDAGAQQLVEAQQGAVTLHLRNYPEVPGVLDSEPQHGAVNLHLRNYPVVPGVSLSLHDHSQESGLQLHLPEH